MEKEQTGIVAKIQLQESKSFLGSNQVMMVVVARIPLMNVETPMTQGVDGTFLCLPRGKCTRFKKVRASIPSGGCHCFLDSDRYRRGAMSKGARAH